VLEQAEDVMTEQVKILVVEDVTTTREMLVNYLNGYRNEANRQPYVVTASASNAQEARGAITDADYAVVVMDLSLAIPDEYPHGFELAELVHQRRPDARIVLWSAFTTVEGDLLRRAARPWGDRFLVDAILGKQQSLQDLLDAIHVICTMPSVYMWVHPTLRPPRGFSAVLAFTHAEDEWIRDFATHPATKPKDMMKRLGVRQGAYYERRTNVSRKVVREMRERHDALLAVFPLRTDHASDDDLVSAMTDEILLKWARRRYLHWPITSGEVADRVQSDRPNTSHFR
jgi:CheY-like chemotaxis protein